MEADRQSQTTANPGVAAKISIALALLAGAVLRVWMLRKFFEVNGDSQLYGGMAKNLLLHGRYALTDQVGELHETLIRLPGYPLFLAACFRLFGMENYYAAACVQILLALVACGLLARFVFRVFPAGHRMAAAQATLWLGALCPFTAVYDAQPLTESLSLCCISLALWSAARFQDRRNWSSAIAFTFAVTFSAFLRPDGALVGVALAPALACALINCAPRTGPHPVSGHEFTSGGGTPPEPGLVKGHDFSRAESAKKHDRALAPAGNPLLWTRLRIAFACLLLALAPFTAWTWRNWQVFHVFQPLAPRYATDPGENTWPGFQRWVKTWCLDFVSTYQFYWNVPAGQIDPAILPPRAFDSPSQYTETAGVFAAYEANGEELSPAIDARFARLATDRIAAHPLRYYLILPVGRVADMWLRPRVENLPIDLDWWVYRHHHVETRFSWFYAGLNGFYLLLAVIGLCLRPRLWAAMLAYMVLRSVLLATIEAPEARYTLECFPMLFAIGGIAIGRLFGPPAARDA